MATEYRIFPWADKENLHTDYMIMSRENDSPVLVESCHSREYAEYRVECLKSADAIAAWPWENGKMLPSTFRRCVRETFGQIPAVEGFGAFNGDGSGRGNVKVVDSANVYLTWTWYDGMVEVAYVS